MISKDVSIIHKWEHPNSTDYALSCGCEVSVDHNSDAVHFLHTCLKHLGKEKSFAILIRNNWKKVFKV